MSLTLPANSMLCSPEFIFGVATSSYQIEGATDGRLPCIWDSFCREPGRIRDGSDGSVACDHVARWREDVDLMASLGIDAYRFSISWPRVIRRDGRLNAEGVDFYLRLIDRLDRHGIKPFVTLYHWDLPQHLQDAGGWLSRDTAYRFGDYADRISRALGDGVHSFATLNEPQVSAYLGHVTGTHAPGLSDPALGRRAAHHLLLAHGLGMQVLEANSPGSLNGIVLNFAPCEPATQDPADLRAAGIADAMHNRWYIEPLLLQRYPELPDTEAGGGDPPVEAGDLELIAQPLDFLGVNYYSRAICRAGRNGWPERVTPPGAQLTDMGWEIYPEGLTELLTALNERYDLPPLYLTENGAAMADRMVNGEVRDEERTEYIRLHLSALEAAIEEGVDVRGYFCWSLMDNFEWAEGLQKRFGLVYVDYATQARSLKASGKAYRDMLAARGERL
jgi:beta-glucosidase